MALGNIKLASIVLALALFSVNGIASERHGENHGHKHNIGMKTLSTASENGLLIQACYLKSNKKK